MIAVSYVCLKDIYKELWQNSKMDKRLFFLLSLFLLTSCGPTIEEKQNIAIITCNIMAESRNMDAAMRIKEINTAREKIKAEPYLLGDKEIKESFEYGLCINLVLNDPEYQNILFELKELEIIANEKAKEEARIAREKREEEARIRSEKRRIANEKAKEEARIAREKREEEARIAQEKAEEEMEIKKEEARRKYANNIIKKRDLDNFELIIKKILLVRYRYNNEDYFNLRVTLDKESCLNIAGLELKIEFLTIHKDTIKQTGVVNKKTEDTHIFLNSFSATECYKSLEERVSISEEDYIKLEETKSVEKIRKDINLFEEVSIEIVSGDHWECSRKDRVKYLMDLCPQDFPPLAGGRFLGPFDRLNNHIQKFKWVNE